MAEAIFYIINKNKNINVKCRIKEPMKRIFDRFLEKYSKNDKNLESFIFKYNNKEIEPESSFEKLANENDKKNKKISITVEIKTIENNNSFSQNTNSTTDIKNSHNKINDKNILPNKEAFQSNRNNLNNTINRNNKVNNISSSIDEIDYSLFKLNPKELKNIFKNKNKKIDYICKEFSNNNNKKHNEKYIAYCQTCEKNLCFQCMFDWNTF